MDLLNETEESSHKETEIFVRATVVDIIGQILKDKNVSHVSDTPEEELSEYHTLGGPMDIPYLTLTPIQSPLHNPSFEVPLSGSGSVIIDVVVQKQALILLFGCEPGHR